MQNNKLVIKINKPINEVFTFCITPPNSTKWLYWCTNEKTNEWPIKIGTVYEMEDKTGKISKVTVTKIVENNLIEWLSDDKNYHCRYLLKQIIPQTTVLEYYEWVDKGNIEEPFTQKILENLKTVIEKPDPETSSG